jgi:hypothetical protein
MTPALKIASGIVQACQVPYRGISEGIAAENPDIVVTSSEAGVLVN